MFELIRVLDRTPENCVFSQFILSVCAVWNRSFRLFIESVSFHCIKLHLARCLARSFPFSVFSRIFPFHFNDKQRLIISTKRLRCESNKSDADFQTRRR